MVFYMMRTEIFTGNYLKFAHKEAVCDMCGGNHFGKKVYDLEVEGDTECGIFCSQECTEEFVEWLKSTIPTEKK